MNKFKCVCDKSYLNEEIVETFLNAEQNKALDREKKDETINKIDVILCPNTECTSTIPRVRSKFR